MTGVDAAPASVSQQRVLGALRRLGGRATARQLADSLDLHVSTVRGHLLALQRAGIVSTFAVATHRAGRPSLEYVVVSDNVETAQNVLLTALAGVVSEHPELIAQVEAEVVQWAGDIPASTRSVVERLGDVFARLGFSPQCSADGLVLRSCPFLATAAAHPEVVCRIHGAVARRLAESLGEAPGGVALLPFSSPEGLCQLRVLGPRGDSAEA